jgi:predicted O-methyltransferase YrrM
MPSDDVIYGRSALRNGEPWITPESLEHLKRIIKPSWNVFEWGSGGSTAFWSRNCKSVISIEHNSEWIKRTNEMMEKFNCPHNYEIIYVKGNGTDYNTAFRDYANAIANYPDESFDLVYVDGEASSRGECVRNAISKLKPHGYLLVDNSDWLKDNPEMMIERYDYTEKDLKWIGQPGTFNWWTSIFRKQ